MFLKSLELNGFKSFAQKTVLEFPKGITAIVGPNGSGKSNVIDGIRWLLGERDAKNLRGNKIENLIFAGSPQKSRAGLASVGLFFDNKSGFFDKDFSEILITRRVSRDGNSQYFLNKSECRLKDIVDFFAKARLGTKGLTIINQGSSDLFVRANSEERRLMIEEVLGLREFQIKKLEAKRKLENTNINLEKVKAVIEEVVPRLKMLRRQTAKWAKREQVEQELKEIENNYFSFKIGVIDGENEKFRAELKNLASQTAVVNNELKILESEVKKIEGKSKRHGLDDVRSQKNNLADKRFELQKEISRLEAKMEIFGNVKEITIQDFDSNELLSFLSEVRANLENSVKTEEFKELAAAVKNLIIRIDEFLNPKSNKNINPNFNKLEHPLAGRKEFENLRNNLAKEIGEVEEKLKIFEKEEVEITAGLEDFNKNFQKAFEAFEKKKDDFQLLENKKQKINFELEKLDLKLRDLDIQAGQNGRKIEEFRLIVKNNQSAESFIANERADLSEAERKMFRLRAELANIGEIDESLLKETESTENHFNFLSSQVTDLERAVADLAILIKDLEEKIHSDFSNAFQSINDNFDKFFKLMFKGGHAKMKIKKSKFKNQNDNLKIQNNNEINEIEDKQEEEKEEKVGVDIELSLPKKKIGSLEMLSGGEKSLVSIAALFALISVSPPPFLVLDEIDAALDEKNSAMFANLIKEFSYQTQFIIVTHNRSVMESADMLYGITMEEEGVSKVLSLKLDTVN
ncbi:MAG: AAA family ATPase [Patescibacteria group bacterium]